MLRMFGKLFCGLFAVVALSSCGAGDIGGGVGEFTTVNASAQATTTRFESDIWTGNTCSNTGSTGGSIQSDYLDVDFTSTAQFATGALDLVISEVTIRYTPANTSTPRLPDATPNWNQIVAPTTTDTLKIPLLTEAQKIALLNHATSPMTLCGSSIYEYNVDIFFTVSELGGNGKPKTVTTRTVLAVADRT